jgi:hypothetical protein
MVPLLVSITILTGLASLTVFSWAEVEPARPAKAKAMAAKVGAIDFMGLR